MKNLLILDDDEDIRFLLRMLLSQSGKFTIHEAESGEQASTYLREGTIDLMILDHMLPDGKGAEFVSQWKVDGLLQQTRLCMLTARRDSAMEEALLALGVEKVFHKPFDPLSLVKELENLFGS